MKVRRLFDNIEVKLICLLLAVVVWLYANNPRGTEAIDRLIKTISRGEQGRITFRKVSVKLVGTEKEWKPIKGHETISIRARIEVQSLESEIDTGDLQAEVELTKKDEEKKSVTLTAENVTLPKGLFFVKAEPETIKITPIP
jgi:YbbR domain-containing protein